ncbi:MAG: hypothetical protein ACI9VR_004678 [Cognaticolwellia sp.]|jgi:hypothetical protein
MIYRTAILVCHTDCRPKMLGALQQGQVIKPAGMLTMAYSAGTDDDTIALLQTWESKKAFDDFGAAMPAEQKRGFAALVATTVDAWHSGPLELPVP